MAKLTGPLFSLSARGAIAETLVYFPWKGLNVVRQHVIPANPQTAAQVTQRSYLSAAVAKLHAAQIDATNPFIAVDLTAYGLLASLAATPRTWFNAICDLWMTVKVAVKVPVIYSDGKMTAVVHTAAIANVYFNEEVGSSIAAGKMFLGTTPTTLIKSKTAVIVPGVNATNSGANAWADLVAGVRYYWQFRPDAGDPAVGAISGIYTFVAT